MKRAFRDRSFIFIVIVGVALLLRLPGIFSGNFAFTYDAGRDLLAVRDIASGRAFSLIGQTTGLAGFFYGPWWYWLLAPPFLLFGGNPTAMAAFIAVLGAFSAGVAFVWGERRFGLVFGTLLGVIFAASPDIVKITNQLWNPDLLVPATLMVIILLSNIDTAKAGWLVLLGFSLALLAEIEMVYGVIFILGFFIAGFLWLRRDLTRGKVVRIGIGILLAETPRILFELRHNFLQIRSLLASARTEPFIFHAKRSWLIYGSLASVIPGDPWIQNIFAVVFLGLLIVFWRRILPAGRRLILVLSTIVATFFVAVTLFPKDFWNYFLFGLPVLYATIVVFAFTVLWNVIPRGMLVVAFVYFFLLLKPIDAIRGLIEPQFIGDAALYKNQLSVVRFVYTQAKGDFKYIAYTPPQYDYTWQYLFWWEGKRRIGPKPNDGDPSEMFVVIEPDPGYSDRVKQWLKVRERDGVLLREISFTGGIVVQEKLLRFDTRRQ